MATNKEEKAPELEKCGVIMPISSIDGIDEAHWVVVKNIIYRAIAAAGFDANLVSDSKGIVVIQDTIVQNVYDNPITVCDVSCKNPNVMFELGMRIAFDKPVVIIKDDLTNYSFDTSPIVHLTYPRDLRFDKMEEFIKLLTDKIKATYESSKKPGYKSYLKSFGNIIIAKLDKIEIPEGKFILNELQKLGKQVNMLSEKVAGTQFSSAKREEKSFLILIKSKIASDNVISFIDFMEKIDGVRSVVVTASFPGEGMGLRVYCSGNLSDIHYQIILYCERNNLDIEFR